MYETTTKTEVSHQIGEAFAYSKICDAYSNVIQRKKKENEEIKKKYSYLMNWKSKLGFIGLGVGLWCLASVLIIGFILFLMLILFIATVQTSSIEEIVTDIVSFIPMTAVLLFLIVGGIVTPIICTKKATAANEKARKDAALFWEEKSATVQQNEKDLAILQLEETRFISKYSYTLDFVPSKYREFYIITFMYGTVLTGRAKSMQEVIEITEEQLHRWKMERALQNMKKLQKNIESGLDVLIKAQLDNKILLDVKNLEIAKYL